MSSFVEWLLTNRGEIASWLGLILSWAGVAISLVGFGGTLYALWSSRFAVEKALQSVASTKVLDNLREAVGLIEELRELHYHEEEANVMQIHYFRLAKLLIEINESRGILGADEVNIINSVQTQMKLASEQCGLKILDDENELDVEQLVTNLGDAQLRLTGIFAATRNKIGERYAR